MNTVGLRSWRPTVLAVMVLAVAFVWAAVAPAAQAAPASTMNLVELQQLLDQNGGQLDGYFKTVLSGDTIVTIPATVQSIVPRMTSDGALIMFAAGGAQIDALGGIASGMSGSPVYVKVAGKPDQLIGAVSYGDVFTKGNLGLATPIEYMVAIQDRYFSDGVERTAAVHSTELAQPLAAAGDTITRVVTAPSAARARQLQVGQGTAVFAPLAAFQIGGLDPRTQAYKEIVARLEARGFTVLPPRAGAGVRPGGALSPLVGGASLGALYSLGDLWVGAAGTVTYVDGSTLLGFGHPLEWLGQTQTYLTDGWVSGVWASTMDPYKLIIPGTVRGTLTQDRNSGIAGTLGRMPAETPVTSRAAYGATTKTSTTTITQALAGNPNYTWIAPSAAYVPILAAVDAYTLPGSATTVSSVVVSDGTQDYTVRRENLWDSSWDVTYIPTNDLYLILAALTANPDGIALASVESVSLETTISPERRSARIVSLTVPAGLATGVNDVQVGLAAYGNQALQTVHVPLEIPAGMPPRGSLEVYGAGSAQSSASLASAAAATKAGRAVAADDRLTLAELVETLNEWPQNNDVVVLFRPESGEEPIQVTAGTEWVASGALQLWTSRLRLGAQPRTIKYNTRATLYGSVELPGAEGGPADGDELAVKIYATPKGGATKLVATIPAVVFEGTASFDSRTARLKTTTRFTAVWPGDDTTVGSRASTTVTVRKPATAR